MSIDTEIGGVTLGRFINLTGLIVALLMAAQASGLLHLLPSKWEAILIAIGATASAFTERLQGGASKA